jgi:hypothetical protein
MWNFNHDLPAVSTSLTFTVIPMTNQLKSTQNPVENDQSIKNQSKSIKIDQKSIKINQN